MQHQEFNKLKLKSHQKEKQELKYASVAELVAKLKNEAKGYIMSVLLIAEHNNKELRPFTLNAITAASQMDGDVHVITNWK